MLNELTGRDLFMYVKSKRSLELTEVVRKGKRYNHHENFFSCFSSVTAWTCWDFSIKKLSDIELIYAEWSTTKKIILDSDPEMLNVHLCSVHLHNKRFRRCHC